MKMCTGFTTDVIWVNTRMCSVTSKLIKSSSARVSSLKDSLALLNNWEVKITRVNFKDHLQASLLTESEIKQID